MTLTNRRHQRAVGQGFFHTAELHTEEGRRFRYVYDCGSMKKYEAQRRARISEYLGQVGPKAVLDVLFISHIHFDHVSGLEQLLDRSNGVRVDTIVMPLINVSNRLIAYARAINEDPSTTSDLFFRDFVTDPENALRRFEPRQILFIRRGSPEGGAPGSGGGDGGGPDFPTGFPRIFKSHRDEGTGWKLVGRGRTRVAREADGDVSASKTSTLVAEIDDTLAITPLVDESCLEWILSPFVDPTIRSREQLFLRELAAARGVSISRLKSWLAQSENVSNLLLHGIADLNTAYEAVAEDFNLTSLCLFSGPRFQSGPHSKSYCAKIGSSVFLPPEYAKIGWLATGDAALKAPSRVKALKKHYGAYLARIGAIALPHHGSDQNHNQALLEEIDALFHIAAADTYSKWRHPGTKVIQCVASMGRLLSVVTSNLNSEVEEYVCVRCLPNGSS